MRTNVSKRAPLLAIVRMTARVIPTIHAAPRFTCVKRGWKALRGRGGTTLVVVLARVVTPVSASVGVNGRQSMAPLRLKGRYLMSLVHTSGRYSRSDAKSY